MNEAIDWPLLAKQLAVRGYGGFGNSSTEGMAALELIVGENNIRQAVDDYVAVKPQAELIRQVLWRLRPRSAMERCYEIYHSNADIDQRRAAIELLRVVADERVLPWIEEFLSGPGSGNSKLGDRRVGSNVMGRWIIGQWRCARSGRTDISEGREP